MYAQGGNALFNCKCVAVQNSTAGVKRGHDKVLLLGLLQTAAATAAASVILHSHCSAPSTACLAAVLCTTLLLLLLTHLAAVLALLLAAVWRPCPSPSQAHCSSRTSSSSVSKAPALTAMQSYSAVNLMHCKELPQAGAAFRCCIAGHSGI
jgi:hypothetical protein